MTSRFKIALISLALAVPGGVVNAGEPIPGVDVNLGKDPGGTAIVVATTDREGRFSVQVRVERGEYAVSTACSPRQACPSNRRLTLSVDGRPVRPDARGRYLFPVGGSLGTVVLSGRVDIFDRWGRQAEPAR
ncbi:MAG: hypothetical protein PSV23_15305 [Brevundimonas sp.]|uniref:hypothetical protein n=1 Tax=Brevundimonas sp. TaxID=1871086 RepID=UPI002489A223|nr:hypothetical protein [Brevundimonas sp.]MDI1328159.1 hypothetical protein [Brevundimonas sp.]